MKLSIGISTAAALVLSVGVAQAGGVIEGDSLGGVWEGTVKCKVTTPEESFKAKLEGTIVISDRAVRGDSEAILIGAVDVRGLLPSVEARGASSSANLCLYLQPDAKKPSKGIGGLSPLNRHREPLSSGTDLAETGTLSWKLFAEKKGVSGQLKAKTILFPGLGVGSCQWKFRRISEESDGVDIGECDGGL